MSTESSRDLEDRLKKTLEECASLKEENGRLRRLLEFIGYPAENLIPPPKPQKEFLIPGNQATHSISEQSSIEAKVALFRTLFGGREDVYPIRWEAKDGRSGYSPACGNEWNRLLCRKPKIKCADCKNRSLLPVTDTVILDHLNGKHTIGVYPLLPDESCWFLAVDFDKRAWREDVAEFIRASEVVNIFPAVERSRSGNGAHIWFFFDRPIPASLARRFGSVILTRAMGRRHQIGFDSYDRFFPSQDTLPKGGFGNLIALPLQQKAREKGNSLFLNRAFDSYPDQWLFLSSLKRIPQEKIEGIVRKESKKRGITDVFIIPPDGEEGDTPWVSPIPLKWANLSIQGALPERVKIVLANLIFVEKEGLPQAMISRLLHLAAFQNPEFYRAQAMRISTFGKPRIIACGEDLVGHIGLPRGCLDDALILLREHHVQAEVTDERFRGKQIEVSFHGELTPSQQDAGNAILAHDTGVLSAPTAFGKTVVAAWLIAGRKVNTLVLVHRRQLMDQWLERLASFLGISPKEIGQFGGGKKKLTGEIDIGILQSLNRKGDINEIVAEYGQIIVDECHHLSAFTFELVLKRARAKYVVGLTATPFRKDGHHPIITMQCGPIRFKETDKKAAKMRPFRHIVVSRHTDFKMAPDLANPGIQDIYASLVHDKDRNNLIFHDLLKVLEMGSSPLVLTERVEHLELLASRLKGVAANVIVLKGGAGGKERKALMDQIKAIPEQNQRVLIATGRYVGEGFDDARLDTLFLVMPISWRGTLQQYAGRLHRLHGNKRVVRIYDYVDIHVPLLMRMFRKRIKAYKTIGYSIQVTE
jgi:superfamily II DNA or RNA helicase